MNKKTNRFEEFSDQDIKDWVNSFHIGDKQVIIAGELVNAETVKYKNSDRRILSLFSYVVDNGYDAFKQRLYEIFLTESISDIELKEYEFSIEDMWKERERERGNFII